VIAVGAILRRAIVCAVLACALAFACARGVGAPPTLSSDPPTSVNTSTQPDGSPDAIWHAAIAQSVVSAAAFHVPTDATPIRGTVSVSPRHHRGAREPFAFSRPHDPPHLNTFALLI